MKLLAEKNADLEMQDIHGDTPFGELFLFFLHSPTLISPLFFIFA